MVSIGTTLTKLSEWNQAVVDAIQGGTTERAALLAELHRKFPYADSKTVAEKVSRFAERGRAKSGYFDVLRTGPRPSRDTPSRQPASHAQGWYERFLRHGLDSGPRKAFRETPDGKSWTVMVLRFLREIGEPEGFQVKDRPELNRWDQSWLDPTGKPIVVIEHENDGSDLESELNHLIPCDAPLRVLITYFSRGLLKSATAELVETIDQRLSQQRANSCEFLLLTARWEIDDVRDYEAHSIRQEWVPTRL